MDGKVFSDTKELWIQKEYDDDFIIAHCPFRVNNSGHKRACMSDCVHFNESVVNGTTVVEICHGKTLTFAVFTIEVPTP